LAEFEDDEIEDFEGWDLIEVHDGPDPDDMSWLFPTKGPGQYKNLKKKKKSKKSGKAKK
jgi:hypothetical protein